MPPDPAPAEPPAERNSNDASPTPAAPPGGPGPRLGRLLPRATWFVLFLLILVMVEFTVLRAGLVLTNHASTGGATAGELAGGFLRGLRFDLSVACYMLVAVAVAGHLPRVGLEASRAHRRALFVVLCVMTPVVILILLAEYEFFREFQTRYNQLAFQYLDQPATVAGMAWYNYPVGRYALVCAVLSVAFLWPARWAMRRLFGDATTVPPSRPGRLVKAGAAMVVAMVIAMRGGLQSEPLRWGDAYRSTNDFANQLGLNGLFCVARSVADRLARRDSDVWLHAKTPLDEARAVTRRLVVAPGEVLLDPTERTVFRRPVAGRSSVTLRKGERRPNVVLVIMESFSARFCGAAGSPEDFTPNFSRLAGEGIFFDHAFSGGTHTHQGIFCTMLGFPNLPGHEYLLEQELGKQAFSSLPTVFKSQGYRTMFLYNGNFSWDNMRGFFQKQGVDTFIGAPDYVNPVKRDRVWGVSDQDVFDRANEEFDRMDRAGTPFFSVVLTLSNHVPYDLPEPLPFEATKGKGELNRRLDAMRYADWSIGRFIERAKSLPYFANTLFVFVGDHGFHVEPRLTETHLLYHHVPLLVYSPGLLPKGTAGRVVHSAAGQVNVGPTIVGLLDWTVPNAYWGRNLFAEGFNQENFAYFKGSGNSGSARAIGFIRGDRMLEITSTGGARLYHYTLWPPAVEPLSGADADATLKQMRLELTSYLKSAMSDLTQYQAGGELLESIPTTQPAATK